MSFPNVIQDISDLENKHITDTSSTTSQINTLKSRMSSVESGKVNTTDLINLIYPVGSIYMSVNNVSPATFLGGTWERIQDRFLLGAGSSYSAGSTGGEASHKLTVAEMPSHSHNWRGIASNRNGGSSGSYTVALFGADSAQSLINQGKGPQSVGSNQAHNNMPPYLAIYIWKRTS